MKPSSSCCELRVWGDRDAVCASLACVDDAWIECSEAPIPDSRWLAIARFSPGEAPTRGWLRHQATLDPEVEFSLLYRTEGPLRLPAVTSIQQGVERQGFPLRASTNADCELRGGEAVLADLRAEQFHDFLDEEWVIDRLEASGCTVQPGDLDEVIRSQLRYDISSIRGELARARRQPVFLADGSLGSELLLGENDVGIWRPRLAALQRRHEEASNDDVAQGDRMAEMAEFLGRPNRDWGGVPTLRCEIGTALARLAWFPAVLAASGAEAELWSP